MSHLMILNRGTYIESLPLEILHQILFFIPYNDTISFCTANRYTMNVFRDDLFWIKKLDDELEYVDHKPSNYIKTWHHPDIRGFDIYRRWIHTLCHEIKQIITRCESYIKRGYNDICIWILNKYISYPEILEFTKSIKIRNICIIAGNLQLLKSLSTWDHLNPNNEKIQCIKKVKEYKGYVISTAAQHIAAEYGHLHILQWLVVNGSYINQTTANIAASSGFTNILEWLSDIGILPSTNIHEITTRKGDHIDLLKWLEVHGWIMTYRNSKHSRNI